MTILWTSPCLYVTHPTTNPLALTLFRLLFSLSTALALAPVGISMRTVIAAAWAKRGGNQDRPRTSWPPVGRLIRRCCRRPRGPLFLHRPPRSLPVSRLRPQCWRIHQAQGPHPKPPHPHRHRKALLVPPSPLSDGSCIVAFIRTRILFCVASFSSSSFSPTSTRSSSLLSSGSSKDATGLRRRTHRRSFPPPCFSEDGPDSVERSFVPSPFAAFNRASRALFFVFGTFRDSTTQKVYTNVRTTKGCPTELKRRGKGG